MGSVPHRRCGQGLVMREVRSVYISIHLMDGVLRKLFGQCLT